MAAFVFHACSKDEAIEPEIEISDICLHINLLENNGSFAEKLNELLTHARNENHESGYILYPSEADVFRYEAVRGEPGEASIMFNPKEQIEGLIHNHYENLFPTFSATDIKAIYDVYKDEHMHNYATFFSGMVSPTGTAYLLKIDDLERFLLFSNQNLLDLERFQDFERRYFETQQAYLQSMSREDSFEVALYDLLKGPGLVYFRSTGSFGIWTRLEKDQSGYLRGVGCSAN